MKYIGKFTLAIIAAGTWWLAFVEDPQPDIVEKSPSHKIDYYLQHFTVLSMTESGIPKQKLRADYLQHFADDDSTELSSPYITMYSIDKPDLHINSDTGYISTDGEIVLLNGKVTIRRESTKDNPSMVINTHNLRVLLNDDFAETDEFVKIIAGQNNIEGTGLRAHFRDPINIKILADVRGHHEIK